MQSEPIEILTLPNEDSIKRKMEPANSTHDIRAVLKQVLNQVEESQSRDSNLIGITTGFAALDDKTLGMQKGDLIVVAARPSMGKTTLVLNLAENVLFSSSKTVIVFSMGAPAALIGSRIISSFGSVNRERMRSGRLNENDWVRLTSVMSQLQNKELYIDDSFTLSPQQLRERVLQIAKKHQGKVEAIVIDDAHKMKIHGFEGTPSEEILAITSSLKSLAQEMNCPVIISLKLCNRVDRRKNKRPILSDFVESENADLVLFIYRDEMYKLKSKDPGVVEIIVGKQKNGPNGSVRLAFQDQFTRFTNLPTDFHRPEFED